jgi:hypothetical protein
MNVTAVRLERCARAIATSSFSTPRVYRAPSDSHHADNLSMLNAAVAMSSGAFRRPLVNPEAARLASGSPDLGRVNWQGLLPSSPPTAFLASLRAILEATPKAAWPRLATAFNDDQVESKLWLAEHLGAAIGLSQHRVVILGAWYGVLALMMDRVMPRPPAHVLCIDIDEATCDLAIRVLSVLSPRPEVRQADMMKIDYTEVSAERPTVFINTSCEHLPDFAGWRQRVPSGAYLVLQSNNHLGCSEHVNCVPDLSAFEQQARLSHVDYRGTLSLRHFERFMLVGRA